MQETSKNEKWYLHGLLLIPSLTPKHLKELKNAFHSFERVWGAGESEVRRMWRDNEEMLQEFLRGRERIDIEKEQKKLEEDAIAIIPLDDPLYPPLLKEIASPPSLLYVRGTLPSEEDISIAIVGTRNYSLYGKEITEPLVGDLVRRGITVVSGLARGIDTFAHRAALGRDGKTIAVLGSGVDDETIYPSQNKKLAKEIIAAGGALVSEFPPGTMPLPHHFPQRNRIIAGLSMGVVVIEAPEESGALITAHCALEANREVFAVPGHIFSRTSRGCHALLKRGAKLVENAEDILEELPIQKEGLSATEHLDRLNIFPPSSKEGELLALLKREVKPLSIDDLTERSGMSISEVSSLLTLMELSGIITSLGHGMYTIKR